MDKPLLGIVSRFTSQKGLDLIADVAANSSVRETHTWLRLATAKRHYEDAFPRSSRPGSPTVSGLNIGYR